jgi:hypothetical protein
MVTRAALTAQLRRLCSPCLFGHASDPLRIRKGQTLYWECRRCSQPLRPVLGGPSPRRTLTRIDPILKGEHP